MATRKDCTIYLRINLNVTPDRAKELTRQFQGLVQKDIEKRRFTTGRVDSQSHYVDKGDPICKQILPWSNAFRQS